mmetsp:Transcript_27978/g.43639  ORF Transcript_27978/g.43639 Transcript_27978/m.43639 type:complete len:273 (-) Transcript_27978:173-991(-)
MIGLRINCRGRRRGGNIVDLRERSQLRLPGRRAPLLLGVIRRWARPTTVVDLAIDRANHLLPMLPTVPAELIILSLLAFGWGERSSAFLIKRAEVHGLWSLRVGELGKSRWSLGDLLRVQSPHKSLLLSGDHVHVLHCVPGSLRDCQDASSETLFAGVHKVVHQLTLLELFNVFACGVFANQRLVSQDMVLDGGLALVEPPQPFLQLLRLHRRHVLAFELKHELVPGCGRHALPYQRNPPLMSGTFQHYGSHVNLDPRLRHALQMEKLIRVV